MKSLLLLSLLPLSLAQDYGGGGTTAASSTSSNAASSTSTASGSIQTIAVGQSGLTFSPNSVNVAVGDSVVFQFYPGGHSATEGQFDTPCAPSNGTGFFSGFVQSSSGPAANVFTVKINDTNPIYFYCALPGHCQAGMVGAINPPSSGNTLAAYKSAASSAGGSTAPAGVQGGVLGPPPKASGSGTSPSATPTGAANTLVGEVGMLGMLMVGVAMVF